ncbi:MAG: hypothetical protein PHT40_03290 [Patescibacteria group bacterium]|nr:hypothetical protein [Patescibacteria group bacterium]
MEPVKKILVTILALVAITLPVLAQNNIQRVSDNDKKLVALYAEFFTKNRPPEINPERIDSTFAPYLTTHPETDAIEPNWRYASLYECGFPGADDLLQRELVYIWNRGSGVKVHGLALIYPFGGERELINDFNILKVQYKNLRFYYKSFVYHGQNYLRVGITTEAAKDKVAHKIIGQHIMY